MVETLFVRIGAWMSVEFRRGFRVAGMRCEDGRRSLSHKWEPLRAIASHSKPRYSTCAVRDLEMTSSWQCLRNSVQEAFISQSGFPDTSTQIFASKWAITYRTAWCQPYRCIAVSGAGLTDQGREL